MCIASVQTFHNYRAVIILLGLKKCNYDNLANRYPRQLTRFGRLLLLLPCLRLVRSSTVELLFFKDTLGDVSIGRVLADIYTNDKHISSISSGISSSSNNNIVSGD